MHEYQMCNDSGGKNEFSELILLRPETEARSGCCQEQNSGSPMQMVMVLLM